MTHTREQEAQLLAASETDGTWEQDVLLSLGSIASLWPELETIIALWTHPDQATGTQLVRDVKELDEAVELARGAVSHEQKARTFYQDALASHTKDLHFETAFRLEEIIREVICAVQHWGHTAAWLKHHLQERAYPQQTGSTIQALMLEAAHHQQRVCLLLTLVLRVYFSYCRTYLLIPTLLEQEDDDQQGGLQ